MTPERWQQIEALYHAVSARPVEARPAFLVEACGGDEALRREVESLLAQPVSAEGMLDRPAADAVPMTSDIAGDGALAGRRLGAYLFQKLIGAGGMGEVYRAHDVKLRRDVAIKILPRAFANDPDRLARFEREARLLASLNHPNIGAIYGLEELDTSLGSGQALVLELVEGETLAERIRRGSIPLAEALPIAGQIADALEAAHEQGIVHRDLKPANIKVRADATVKVLDFGLAKAMERPAAGSSPSVSQSPTIAPSTEAGMILGTAAYMSPEQARGRTVDRRADVWAFGAVLFEMLTGKRAFRGATVPDTMVAILEREPDWNSLPAATPVSIRRLLERCLTKEPKRRLRDIGDAALDLAPPGPADRPRGASRPDRRAWIATTVLSLALVAALIPAVRSRPAPAVDPGLPLESVFLTSTHGRELEPALARDGQRVTYVWDGPQGDNFDLYTKVIGAEVALRLTTHPAHDGSPAWSPDGRWIAFIRVEGSGGTLFLIPSTGGPERKLREVSPWFGSSISFSPDGRWIAISERPAPAMPFGVVLIATETRETRILTHPDPSFAGDAFPAFSPDGQTLAFARIPRVGETLSWANIFVAPVSGGEGRALARVGRVVGGVGWTRDGREVLFSANHRGEGPQLWRVPMTGGDPTRALADEFSFSDVVGAETLTQVSRFFRFSVAFGADRLAYSQSQYQTDIWQFDLASARPRAPRPYAASTQIDEAPQFSPDGRHIAFASTRGSKRPQIWVCDAAGSGCAQITRFNSACGTPRWSPDSQRLAFDSGETGQPEIFVVEVATGVWRQFTSDKATDVVPAWSRNGSSIYFASDRNGAFQVWRMAVAGGPAVQVTTKGGFAAFESPDGRDLYFTQYEKPGLWAMPAQGGPERHVLDQPACWGYWALAPHGVYILDSAGSSGPRIALHRWGATGVEDVANVPAAPACGESGLTLSPDGGTLLYVGTARESDIVMIDHFR